MRFIEIAPKLVIDIPYHSMSERARLSYHEIRLWLALNERPPRWGVFSSLKLNHLAVAIRHSNIQSLASEINEMIEAGLVAKEGSDYYMIGFDEIQARTCSARVGASESMRKVRSKKRGEIRDF